MSEDKTYPYGEFDATQWAAEFTKRFHNWVIDDDIDTELMTTWFANAIMTGYERGRADKVKEIRGEWPLSEEPPADVMLPETRGGLGQLNK